MTFLLVFFPSILILYFLIPGRKCRNYILLAGSLLFYSWGEPRTIFLMLFEIAVNYFLALKLEKTRQKFWLYTALFIDIGILFFFKYFNFFVQDILFLKNVSFSITLPIGISFYTFQIISYIIDVYRGDVKAQKNILYFGCYVTMFPQLIAGPIVRYQTIAEELNNRKETSEDFAIGLRRFIIGLGKKIILANQMAIIADKIFSTVPPVQLTTMLAWTGSVAYMMQIYYDFSGYSDMAIGLGRIFGFHFDENFNYPYLATSVTDFWHRWHISLSTWFRDYVYIPLGGSRVSTGRWVLNLAAVWILTGLWHGAAYNFILWGIYYGALLVFEKLWLNSHLKNRFLKRIYTLIAILIGWIIFNANRLLQIALFLNRMFHLYGSFNFNIFNNIGILYLWPYFLLSLIGCTPLFSMLAKKVKGNIVMNVYSLFVLALCLLFLVNNSYNPFIYFRF